MVSSSYCELVLQLCSWGPSIPLYTDFAQVIPNPRDVVCTSCVLLQLHEQAHPSRPLTKLHVRGVDWVRKHYDKLTGAFSFATGPEKELCSLHACCFLQGMVAGQSHANVMWKGQSLVWPAKRTVGWGKQLFLELFPTMEHGCFQLTASKVE